MSSHVGSTSHTPAIDQTNFPSLGGGKKEVAKHQRFQGPANKVMEKNSKQDTTGKKLENVVSLDPLSENLESTKQVASLTLNANITQKQDNNITPIQNQVLTLPAHIEETLKTSAPASSEKKDIEADLNEKNSSTITSAPSSTPNATINNETSTNIKSTQAADQQPAINLETLKTSAANLKQPLEDYISATNPDLKIQNLKKIATALIDWAEDYNIKLGGVRSLMRATTTKSTEQRRALVNDLEKGYAYIWLEQASSVDQIIADLNKKKDLFNALKSKIEAFFVPQNKECSLSCNTDMITGYEAFCKHISELTEMHQALSDKKKGINNNWYSVDNDVNTMNGGGMFSRRIMGDYSYELNKYAAFLKAEQDAAKKKAEDELAKKKAEEEKAKIQTA